MPVYKVGDKWKIGKEGKPRFKTKDAAEKAFKHWIDTKESEETVEMTKRVDEKFELSKDKQRDDVDVHTMMKLAGINKKMEDDQDSVDFDGVFTGVADGEIKVDEDLEKMKSLAGLSENKVKKSIFSRDQELDRFAMFKEMEENERSDSNNDLVRIAADEYQEKMYMYSGHYDSDDVLNSLAKRYHDLKSGQSLEDFRKQLVQYLNLDENQDNEDTSPYLKKPLRTYAQAAADYEAKSEKEKEHARQKMTRSQLRDPMREGDVVDGPWGQGGSQDPQVRDLRHKPDSAEIMDKFWEFYDPDYSSDPDEREYFAASETLGWLQEEMGLSFDEANDLMGQALQDAELKQRKQANEQTDLSEVAPPGEKAERFIRGAKADFKKRYGDRWQEVLYATAWDMFGEQADQNVRIEEKQSLNDMLSGKVFDNELARKFLGGLSSDIMNKFKQLGQTEREAVEYLAFMAAQADDRQHVEREFARAHMAVDDKTDTNMNALNFQHVIYALAKNWHVDFEDEVKRMKGATKDVQENSDDVDFFNPQDAYDQGRLARSRGVQVLENPFSDDVEQFNDWIRGWEYQADLEQKEKVTESNFDSVGDYVEELDLAVSAEDQEEFRKIVDNLPSMNNDDDTIRDMVNRLPKDKQRKLLDQLHMFSYDYDMKTSKLADPDLGSLLDERKSKMFAEGSYDRMVVELIVEEMKKGKSENDISETLGFGLDEVSYVVEFFKNKKQKQSISEQKEVIEESKNTDSELDRIKYLTEYKN